MNTGTVIAIVVIVIIVLAIIAFALMTMRRRETASLKDRFGSEYDRTVGETGNERQAGSILKERVERVNALNIVPLSYTDREQYTQQWRDVQAQFVDDPAAAVGSADDLVQDVMAKRGYPVGDFEQRAADISVDHPDVVDHYRTAHDIAEQQSSGDVSTEDLRQAMVHYRALFEDLLRPETADMATETAQ
jgi:FtsZ-interacting cell division protein ZipA